MPAIAYVYGDTARMDPNTFGDGVQDPEDSSAYWRRRVFALGGVIAVVAVLAWACSGSGGNNSQQAAEQSASPSTGSGGPVAPLAQTGTPSVTPSASPSGSASPSASAKPSKKRHAGDRCEPGDVVVTSDLGGSSYAVGERPEFRFTVVNTGKLTCSYDIGGLELRITSGSDRIWSSTDCASGAAHKKLKRGVPYTRTVTWNRTRSSSKCHETHEQARPGTYVVRLRGNHVKAKSQVFHLR